MAAKIYLAQDGSWGDAEGLLVFAPDDISLDLWERMTENPEGTYEEIRTSVVGKE